MSDDDIAARRRRIQQASDRARTELSQDFATEFATLAALSREEIEAIVPDGTGQDVYDALMAVVEEATRDNLSQAELKNRVLALGGVAVDIVRTAGGLAARLGL